MPGYHFIQVPDAKPKISNTLAGLSVGQYDGHVGIIRIGVGVDAYEEMFIWDSDARAGVGGWVGAEEHVVLGCDDAWALDWTRQPLSSVRNQWCRPNGGVGWARSGAAAMLRADVVIPSSGSFQFLIHDFGADTLPPQGNLTVRGMIFTYNGVTVAAGACTVNNVLGGIAGVTLKGNADPLLSPTPIIPYAPVLGGGGDPGGWGTTPNAIDHVGEMWAAGFRLEERMHAWMNGSQDLKSLQIAPFYLNYDIGDDFDYPDLLLPPPSGLLGPGMTLIGPIQNMAGITSGSGSVIEERKFQWVEKSWQLWTPAAPTKRVLVPVLYGKMPADANDTGQTYGVTLSLRWMQP